MPHTIAALNPLRHAGVTQVLREASATVGEDFGYLLDTASRESSLNPSARAATSSASGLFQFTGQTWLGVMKRHGAEHGLGAEAAGIQLVDGRYKVPDASARQAILALRNNPKIAALMAGEFTAENRQRLQGDLGRPVSEGELYTAHVMGAGGAAQLISAAENHPSQNAAHLFPAAAKANRAIFFDDDGMPRSVAQVTAFLTGGNSAPAVKAAALPEYDVAALPLPDLQFEEKSAVPEWTPATQAANGSWNGSLKVAAPGSGGGAAGLAGLGQNFNMLSPDMFAILASLDAPERNRRNQARLAAPGQLG